jgi:hypothetical protein
MVGRSSGLVLDRYIYADPHRTDAFTLGTIFRTSGDVDIDEGDSRGAEGNDSKDRNRCCWSSALQAEVLMVMGVAPKLDCFECML